MTGSFTPSVEFATISSTVYLAIGVSTKLSIEVVAEVSFAPSDVETLESTWNPTRKYVRPRNKENNVATAPQKKNKKDEEASLKSAHNNMMVVE